MMNIVWCLPMFGSLFSNQISLDKRKRFYTEAQTTRVYWIICCTSCCADARWHFTQHTLWASLELDFLGEDLWFLIHIMNIGMDLKLSRQLFLRISLDPFNSISGDFVWTCPRTCGQRWCGLCNLSAAHRRGKRRWKEKFFSIILKTFQISISLRFIFGFAMLAHHPLVFCVMPVMSLIFRGSRTKVHYRELHCDSHDLDWPSRPMVRWVESGSWDSWLGCDILQNPAECAVCIFQIFITYNLYM